MSGETVLGRDAEGRVREYALATQPEVDALPEGGVTDPATLSRLVVHMAATISGIASEASVFYAFDTEDDSVGTDIEVDGGDDESVNILTDGVYAITASGLSIVGAGPIKYAHIGLYPAYPANPGPSFQGPADGYNNYTVSPSWVGVLEAGSVIKITADAETSNGTDTWSLSSGTLIFIQRIAP